MYSRAANGDRLETASFVHIKCLHQRLSRVKVRERILSIKSNESDHIHLRQQMFERRPEGEVFWIHPECHAATLNIISRIRLICRVIQFIEYFAIVNKENANKRSTYF